MNKIISKQWMIILLSFLIFFNSCEEEGNTDSFPKDFTGGAFITNEGAYGAGNGSVSFYSFEKDKLYNDVFKTVNGRVLGDVVQSISIHNELAFIVVNGSNKIEVVNAEKFTEVGVITDVALPRYYIGINQEKGYVSEWGTGFGTNVKVIDYSTLSVTKTITVGTGPERMILLNNLVYVANSGGWGNDNTISVIDTETDEVIKTISLDGDSPRDFVVDMNTDLWVICAGYIDYSDMSETPSKLIRINTTTNEVAETITIGETFHPSNIEISSDGSSIFYGGGYAVQGIYKMGINENIVPARPVIDKSFYGFNIDPETGIIFALEAPSYTVNGTLWRYEANGTLLGSYEAGVGPNGAGFSKK